MFVRLLFLICLVLSLSITYGATESLNEFDTSDYSVKITSQTGDQSPVIEGESVSLFCDVRSAVNGLPPKNPARVQYRWLCNGNNLIAEPRKHSNGPHLSILKIDYTADGCEYKCQAFFSDPSRMFESAPYSLNIHWISKSAEIVHFKYPEQDEDVDLPLQALPIEPVNQFKAPFKLALSCQASGYPELQVGA